MVQAANEQMLGQARYLAGPGRLDFIQSQFKVVGKDRRIHPLILNPVQRQYWDTRTLRDRHAKPRQMGMSTIVLADYVSEAMLTPGINALFSVQKPEEKTLTPHRRRAQLFYDGTDPALKPPIKVSNNHELSFDFPDGLTSTIYFSASGSEGVGAGETVNRAARDEIRYWEHEEVEASREVLLGMPADSRIVDMSTPSYWGSPWHELCLSADNNEDFYTYHVYYWFQVPEYEAQGFEETPNPSLLAKLTQCGWTYDGEATLRIGNDLTDAQLQWRRQMIVESNSIDTFWRTYLEDKWTCWTLGGEPVMPSEYIRTLLARAREPLSGLSMPPSSPPSQMLRVWLPPSTSETYVIMGDPAEGLGTSHLSAAVVRRMSDWAHCATIRGHIDPGTFGDYLVWLGRWYNDALVGWERNNHGWGVMERVTTHHAYSPVYTYMGVGDQAGDMRLGFPTNAWTKPALVSLVLAAMQTGGWHSWDAELIGQYLSLQDEGNGRYDTAVLDILMADLLCHPAKAQAAPPFQKKRRDRDQQYLIPRYLRAGRR